MGPNARIALSELCSKLSRAQSVETVQAILDGLNGSVLSDDHVESLARKLLAVTEHEHLLELVLAYGSWSRRLSAWLLKSFPKNSVDEFRNSIHSDILERLSRFFYSLPCTFEREQQRFLTEDKFRVEKIPHLLKYMIDIDLDNSQFITVENAASDAPKGQQLAQNKMRNMERRRQDLARLGMTDPESKAEAAILITVLLKTLKETLSRYLELLREPEVYSKTQTLGVGSTFPDVGNHEEEEQTSTEVTPMAASLFFESAAVFGAWRIMVSARCNRDLRNARKSDAKFFRIVMKKIIELSNGQFSDDNHKRLNGPNIGFPIFEAKMTRDSRLVYQIDCVREYESNFERQAIKLFGIYTHAQIDKRFWDSMGRQLFSMKGREYRDRCTFREQPHQKGDYVVSPAIFPPLECEMPDKEIVPELPEEHLDQIQSLLILDKFVALSKELLKSIVVDLDVSHVFDPSPREKEIIEHPNSCYVIGRSGTGKTTTMLFKMLGIERAYAQQPEGIPRPRQMFVTQSRVLATRVEEAFSKLMASLAATNKSREELEELAEQQKLQRAENSGLYDVDDDVTWKAGLPKKFSLLQDQHFPLFLTFDRLCQLLEGDIEKAVGVTRKSTPSIITYETFLQQYWPHFPESLTKKLSPALVFSEILGIIKGSEESLSHQAGYLDSTAYINFSSRTQRVFARQRDRVYLLFQAYMKQKRLRGELDMAERTHQILKAFGPPGRIKGKRIDYLYVDEAQDNLLIDAMLLRSLCGNPNGLFWAGDTAQTIAIGSSFRFDELKALLHRFEESRKQVEGKKAVPQSELRIFQLSVNYRSHGGIVRCATAVVELISHFWPDTIDHLAPEQGLIDGAKPLFFGGCETNKADYKQFLSKDSGERIEFGARQCILVRDEAAKAELEKQVGDIGLILTLYESKGLEFDDVLLYRFFEDSTVGFKQWCVVLNLIVEAQPGRAIYAPHFDEELHAGVCSELKFLYVAITRAKKKLWIVDYSDKAIPMKELWDSKGYINCVTGGEIPQSQSMIPRGGTPQSSGSGDAPRYGHRPTRHGDNIPQPGRSQSQNNLPRSSGNPPLSKSKALQASGSTPQSLYQLAQKSNDEEWIATGRTLFATRRYLPAMHAFKRAQAHREADISHAHHLRDTARSMSQPVGRKATTEKRTAFCSAAEAFLRCARHAEGKEQRVFFHDAADCFENAGSWGENTDDYERAARAYEDAKEYTPAVALYKKADMFDDAVRVIQEHRSEVDEELAKSVQEVARLFYFKNKDLKKAEALFESVEAQLEYLEENILLDDCHAAVLAGLGRHQEAADIHMAEGRTMEAIDALLDDKQNDKSQQRANECILRGLWDNTSFSRRIEDTHTAALEFLDLAESQKDCATLPSVTQKDELEMFQNLRKSDNAPTFRQLAHRFLEREEIHQAVLCFDHYFTSFPSTRDISNADMVRILEDFGLYSRNFRNLISELEVADEDTQKLFNFFPASIENTYKIRTETWLHQQVTNAPAKPETLEHDDGGLVTIQGDELRQLLRVALWSRLQHRILDENRLCQGAPVFNPCLPFVMNSECRRVNCPRHHIDYQDLTQDWFNCQIRIHLLQILIYHLYLGIPTLRDRRWTINDKRYWIHRLHETLRPAAHYLGSEASLLQSESKVPEAAPGSQTVVKWLRDILGNRSLSRYPDRALLTFLYDAASLLMLFDPNNARNDLMMAPLLRVFARRPSAYFNPEGAYVVAELYQCLRAVDRRFISGGIFFFQHIVNRKIAIDINVLCHLAEFLAGSFILARVRFNLHNVVLPRGWILALLRHITMRDPDTTFFDRLLSSMKVLLEDLIKGGEEARYMLWDGTDIGGLPGLRNLFIHRICRAIGLIGYNSHVSNVKLRSLIFQILQVLKTTRSHTSFRRFTAARTWGGIVVAVEDSCSDSHLDEMVQLCSLEKPKPLTAPRKGVRRLFFKNLQDIPTVLSTGPLNAQAKAFTPRSQASNQVEGQADDATAEPDQEIEQPDADATDLVDSRGIADSQASAAAPLAVEHISQEQKDAALCFIKFYRKRVERQQSENAKTSTQKACDSYFDECLKLAPPPKKTQSLNGYYWNGYIGYYWKLYLGLVPHLLVCVKGLERYAFHAKAEAKKRYRGSEKQDYDDVHKTTNEIVTIIKGCKRLSQQLSPSSEVHKMQDIEGLKQLVRELKELVPSSVSADVQDNLQLAIKGILTEPKTLEERPEEQPRPELNQGYLEYELSREPPLLECASHLEWRPHFSARLY